MKADNHKQKSGRIVYCPNCGAKIEEEQVFCGKCGCQIKRKEEKKCKIAAANMVVVAVAFLVAGGVFALLKHSSLGLLGKKNPNLFYVKEDTLYGVNLEKPEKKPMEFGTDSNMGELVIMTRTERMHGEDMNAPLYFRPELVSENGNGSLSIGEIQIGEDGLAETYTLFYSEGGNEKIKVDSEVETHRLTKDDRIVYQKGGNLYLSDCETITRLASGVDKVFLDKEKTKILWTDYKEKDDRIVYQKGGNLYLSDCETITRLASGVDKVFLDKEKTKILWTDYKE